MKIYAIIIVFFAFLWNAPDFICEQTWPLEAIAPGLNKKYAKCSIIVNSCVTFLNKIMCLRASSNLIVVYFIPAIALYVIDVHLAKFIQDHEEKRARLKKPQTIEMPNQKITNNLRVYQSEAETRFDNTTKSVKPAANSEDNPSDTFEQVQKFKELGRSINKTLIIRRIVLVFVITEAPSFLNPYVASIIEALSVKYSEIKLLDGTTVPNINYIAFFLMEICIAIGNLLNLPILYMMDKNFKRKLDDTLSLRY